MTTTESRLSRLRALAQEPVDAASLGVYRFLLGAIITLSALRLELYGWTEELFIAPRFFFKYYGFAWVEPLPGPWMHTIVYAAGGLGILVALGWFYRAAVVLLFVAFAYLQLIDVTNYLNHYYLVFLMLLLGCFAPLGRGLSLDAALRGRGGPVPRGVLWLFRAQVALVYFYAGLAKLNADWLLEAQPLNIWLFARADQFFGLGDWFSTPLMAYAMSWAGFLFDLTIALWLSLARTRRYAFLVVVVFHALTQFLFPIGMFPSIMVASATLFFAPDWPRRFVPRPRPSPAPAFGRFAQLVCSTYLVIQVLVPLRHFLYGSGVTWHEQGMRFAWKVMAREKNGTVSYWVDDLARGRSFRVEPRRYLSDRQLRDFATQPDLILQLAHRIAKDLRTAGDTHFRVRADARASLNGRPPTPLIDPGVDLAAVPEGLGTQHWIRPFPESAPVRLRAPRWTQLGSP